MSSDSSDEENLELLREAQDTQFINDSMFSDSPKKLTEKSSDSQTKKSLPSLRRTGDDDEQFNFLKVTPEFRSYVAKQLSSILDRKLEKKFVDLEAPESPRKKRKKGGIKLLTDSKNYLKLRKAATENINNTNQSTRPRIVGNGNSYNIDLSEEVLKEIAVSPKDILDKKEVKSWSQRSKAPVFRYKKTKNGQLQSIEPEFK